MCGIDFVAFIGFFGMEKNRANRFLIVQGISTSVASTFHFETSEPIIWRSKPLSQIESYHFSQRIL